MVAGGAYANEHMLTRPAPRAAHGPVGDGLGAGARATCLLGGATTCLTGSGGKPPLRARGRVLSPAAIDRGTARIEGRGRLRRHRFGRSRALPNAGHGLGQLSAL